MGEDVIERHYKTRELAELLGLHPETIRRAAQRGQLDSVRMARAGMKPELIADRVGHRDGGGLIYRRYRHLFPSEMRTAVGLLDALVLNENGTGAAGESGH